MLLVTGVLLVKISNYLGGPEAAMADVTYIVEVGRIPYMEIEINSNSEVDEQHKSRDCSPCAKLNDHPRTILPEFFMRRLHMSKKPGHPPG